MSRIPGVTLIALVNVVAAVLHVLFWALAFSRLADASARGNDPASLATTFGFGVADLVWATPLLVAGSVWLYRRALFGWLAAQMANVLYWYSLTIVVVRDVRTGTVSPGTILFSPFALFAFWAAIDLWRARHSFWEGRTARAA